MLSRAVLDGVNNLCVLGGDAALVLERIKTGQVLEVFVNFPEPPAVHTHMDTPSSTLPSFVFHLLSCPCGHIHAHAFVPQARDEDSDKHLLNAPFLRALGRVLRAGGIYTMSYNTTEQKVISQLQRACISHTHACTLQL
jgi:hypothetical protein